MIGPARRPKPGRCLSPAAAVGFQGAWRRRVCGPQGSVKRLFGVNIQPSERWPCTLASAQAFSRTGLCRQRAKRGDAATALAIEPACEAKAPARRAKQKSAVVRPRGKASCCARSLRQGPPRLCGSCLLRGPDPRQGVAAARPDAKGAHGQAPDRGTLHPFVFSASLCNMPLPRQ